MLFHSVVEIVTVFIGLGAFVATASTYQYSKVSYSLFLGAGYLCISLLDLSHLFVLFPDHFTGLREDATGQFWLLARFFEALLLIFFIQFINKELSVVKLIAGSLGLYVLSVVCVYFNWLPPLYTAASGLTQFDLIAEYFIIGLMVIGVVRTLKAKSAFSPSEHSMLMGALLTTLLAELLFLDLARTMLGTVAFAQAVKLVSFWLLYLALIDNTIAKPFSNLLSSFETYNLLPDAICVLTKTGKVLQSNASTQEYAALGEEALLGKNIHTLLHASDVEQSQCSICQAIGSLQQPQSFEVNRDDRYFEISVAPSKSKRGDARVIHICRDATTRYLSQKNFSLINRLYSMLRASNQAIFKHKDEDLLLRDLCDISIKYGGFELAWFGLLQGNKVVPYAYSGKNKDYVQSISIDITESHLALGPVARAINSNSICYVNDMEKDPSFAPWREQALAAGFKSVVTMPWQKDGKVAGVFALYAGEREAFDEDTLDLIQNLSNDISHILSYIDAEKSRREVEGQLTQMSSAIEQGQIAILITDTNLVIEYVNAYFCLLNGVSEDNLIGNVATNVLEFLPEEREKLGTLWKTVQSGGIWEGEIRVLKPNGEKYWAYENVAPVFSNEGEMTQVIWTSRDNSELHSAQETIYQLAFYDTLTELPNRRLFQDRMHKALQLAQRNNHRSALLFFDVDDFKSINDSLGHDYGDKLLQHMSDVLKSSVRASDTVARLGGDEFTIIMQGIESEVCIKRVTDSIVEKLNTPALIGDHKLTVSTSIGVSIYPLDGVTTDTLMKKADMAMYHAKSLGKNICKLYDESIAEGYLQKTQMKEHITQALAQNDFCLHYQPQFDTRNGGLIGVEVLIRWQHAELGWLSPDSFISVAEQSDLIVEIDRWVINSACQQMNVFIEQGFPHVKLAVNISAVHFNHGKLLISTIEQALANSGLPPHLLQIELTEGSLIEDAELAIQTINAIKELGASLAIDDFGTGYSSLSYLQRFPVDIIKVDRSFIQGLENEGTDRSIVNAVIKMAHSLGLQVLAEGVELDSQLAYLREQKCDYFQGYLKAKPMCAEDLQEFVKGL